MSVTPAERIECLRALVAACHSRACAPPPVGEGGSIKGPGRQPMPSPRGGYVKNEEGRREWKDAEQDPESFELRRGLLNWTSWYSAKRQREAARRITGLGKKNSIVFEPQIGDRPPLGVEDIAYGPSPFDVPEEDNPDERAMYEREAKALLDAVAGGPRSDDMLYRYINVPDEDLALFDEEVLSGHVDAPLAAVGNSINFVERFAYEFMPPPPRPYDDHDSYDYYGDVDQYNPPDLTDPKTHTPVLIRILPGARHVSPGRAGVTGTYEESRKIRGDSDIYRERPGRFERSPDGSVKVHKNRWEEFITGGHFEVVSDQAVQMPNHWWKEGDPNSERWVKESRRVVTLRQVAVFDGKGNRRALAASAEPLEFHGTDHNEKTHGRRDGTNPRYRAGNTPLKEYLTKMRNRPGMGVPGVYTVSVFLTDRTKEAIPGEYGRTRYKTRESVVEVDAQNETEALEIAHNMVQSRNEQRITGVKPHSLKEEEEEEEELSSRVIRLWATAKALQEFHGEDHNEKDHGRRDVPDPGQRYERLFMEEQDALQRAEEYKARGWTHMATLARREASGKKSARTRLARTEGWI